MKGGQTERKGITGSDSEPLKSVWWSTHTHTHKYDPKPLCLRYRQQSRMNGCSAPLNIHWKRHTGYVFVWYEYKLTGMEPGGRRWQSCKALSVSSVWQSTTSNSMSSLTSSPSTPSVLTLLLTPLKTTSRSMADTAHAENKHIRLFALVLQAHLGKRAPDKVWAESKSWSDRVTRLDSPPG